MVKAKAPTDDDAAEAAAAATFRSQIRFWLIAAALFILFIYVFSGILLPFVAGMVLAYFLDPVADRLEKAGLSRVMATVLILVAFVILLALGLVLLIPILSQQLSDFIGRLPEYLSRLQGLVTEYNPEWLKERFGVDPGSLREGLNSLLSSSVGFSRRFSSPSGIPALHFSTSRACLSSLPWSHSICFWTGIGW